MRMRWSSSKKRRDKGKSSFSIIDFAIKVWKIIFTLMEIKRGLVRGGLPSLLAVLWASSWFSTMVVHLLITWPSNSFAVMGVRFCPQGLMPNILRRRGLALPASIWSAHEDILGRRETGGGTNPWKVSENRWHIVDILKEAFIWLIIMKMSLACLNFRGFL